MAVLAGAAILVASPLVSLVWIAARGDAATWWSLVRDVLPVALWETTLLLGGVAVAAGAAGIGAAWLVTAHRFPGRDLLVWLLPLPLAVPAYITAYVYVEVFDAAGPVQAALRALMGWRSRADYWFPEVRSLPGCILVMSAVLYPYVYITARAMFLTQSASMLEAARTLGAGRLGLFRAVALPLARPALAVGLSLALLEALNDIGASEYLGVRTLTVSVYTTWLNRGSLHGAAQLACAMLGMVLLLFALEQHGRGHRSYRASSRKPRAARPEALDPWPGLLASAACALPVLLGFALPVGFLVKEVIGRGLLATVDAAFLRHLGTTIVLATAATLATVLLGVVVVTAARLARHRLASLARHVAGLGYAVPGTVLALGLLAPVLAVDGLLDRALAALTGWRPGLVLMGSGAAIALAYMIRFLPVATGSLQAGLDRLQPGIEDAAQVLGARPRDLVIEVELPLLRPALAGAALLVFIDCLKELPATLLLRPLNTETLATLVYGAASRGSFEDGSLAALLITLVGIGPVARLVRGAESRHERAPPEAG